MAHEPSDETRYTVECMSTAGLDQSSIAAAIGIDAKTLRKHYRDELDNACSKNIARVTDGLLRQALSGNVTAQIFFLKTRAGWKETTIVESGGKDPVRMTDAELEAIARASSNGTAKTQDGASKPDRLH